jgi:hypothetical protein
MNTVEYVGMEVHKKSISICVKLADGQIVKERRLKATQPELLKWIESRRLPWIAESAGTGVGATQEPDVGSC